MKMRRAPRLLAFSSKRLSGDRIPRPNLRSGEDKLEFTFALQAFQIPIECCAIAHQFLRVSLEKDDDPGFVKLHGAPIDKFHAKDRFSTSGLSLHQDHVFPGYAAIQDGV